MTINWMLVATISAPILAAFFGVWLNSWFENRPRLIVFYGHVSEFDVNPADSAQAPFKVHTHSVVVRNTGRRPAKNVRIGHAILPSNFKVSPIINHEVVDLPGGGKEILIPNFVPGKQVTVSYLYYPPLTWNQINTHVESDEGMAKVIEVLPTPQTPKWLQRLLWLLIIIGTTTVLYFAFTGLKWLLA